MAFKFEKLEVWQLAMDYLDLIYKIAGQLPRSEEYNLKAQMVRAATSIVLNVSEGSTGQTDTEQARFLGLAIRSLLETVACQHIINRRKYFQDQTPLREAYRRAETLAMKLQAMRNSLAPHKPWLREEVSAYEVEMEDDGRQTTDDGR